jgi:hypothetical protein
MTQQIKRYGTSSMECENGIYVLHTEYEKVLAECERLRADAARYDFMRSRAELRQYEMGYYWYIRTIDVPMGMPPMAATLANVIDTARVKDKK